MTRRVFPLLLLLAAALLPAGCASDESSDDQYNTFQTTPDKPEDTHGWGANLQGMGGGRGQ